MNIIRSAGLLAVAVAVLAGCGEREAADPPGGDGAGTTMETMETAGSPGMEGGGPEPPRTGDGGVAVSLPGLPVGGSAGDESQVHQCADASWNGKDIPYGVSIEVTGVDFDPRGVFVVDSADCDGESCVASFAFTSEQRRCSVPVRAVVSDRRDADLLLLTTCPGEDAEKCRDIVTASDPGSVQLHYSPPGQPSEEQSPETTGTTEATETSTTG